ncbi:hypothetical protein [Nocardioides sp.]|uniref:hypothetical protein n=1 Tax=Nocardioides sp. TaxID=35761 RepID=UPI003D0F673B
MIQPLHMGALHPFEQVLVFLLAFGPFAALAIVVYVVRKRDAAGEEEDDESGSASTDPDRDLT